MLSSHFHFSFWKVMLENFFHLTLNERKLNSLFSSVYRPAVPTLPLLSFSGSSGWHSRNSQKEASWKWNSTVGFHPKLHFFTLWIQHVSWLPFLELLEIPELEGAICSRLFYWYTSGQNVRTEKCYQFIIWYKEHNISNAWGTTVMLVYVPLRGWLHFAPDHHRKIYPVAVTPGCCSACVWMWVCEMGGHIACLLSFIRKQLFSPKTNHTKDRTNLAKHEHEAW